MFKIKFIIRDFWDAGVKYLAKQNYDHDEELEKIKLQNLKDNTPDGSDKFIKDYIKLCKKHHICLKSTEYLYLDTIEDPFDWEKEFINELK